MGGTDFSELLRKVAKYASNRRGQLLTIFVLIFIPTFIRRRRLAIAAAQSRAAVKGGEAVVKATPKTTWLAFSEFLQNVETGNVSKVLLDSNVFTFILKEKGEEELFKTRPVSMHLGVVDLLHSKGVTFDQVVHRPPGWTLGSALVLLLPIAYLGVIAGVLYKFYDQTGGGEVGNLNDPNHATNDGRRGKKAKPIRFEDVAGADAAKGIVEEVSDFLRYPEKYEAVGARLPTGILLVGPPGTGKTMLAKAIATEAGLPFFYCSGSDFVEVFAGRGAARVRKLFQKAERAAPSMIFFDEIDALGRSRSGDGGIHTNEEREQTLNQLLSCMDGFSSDKRVVVMAATNRFDVLDRALTRPGRFDRVTHVELPDEQGREAILKVHVRRNDIFVAPDTDFQLLAALSEGLAGADLAMIVNEAAIRAARDLREVVVTEDFLHALDTYKTSRQRQPINGISFIDSILKGTTQ